MSGRMDGRPGDEGEMEPRRASRVDKRQGEDTPSRDAEETEREKANAEIEAGDLADDLADFA